MCSYPLRRLIIICSRSSSFSGAKAVSLAREFGNKNPLFLVKWEGPSDCTEIMLSFLHYMRSLFNKHLNKLNINQKTKVLHITKQVNYSQR